MKPFSLLTAFVFSLALCLAPLPALATDVSVTATGVLASSSASTKHGIAGATMTAGQVIYLDSATNTYKLAKATDAITVQAAGIALHGASSGQPIKFVTRDPDFTAGVTVTEGTHMVVSPNNAGGISATADLASGNYPYVFGIVKFGGHWIINFDTTPLSTGHGLP